MVFLEVSDVLWQTEIVFILTLKIPVSEFAGKIWVLTEAEAPESRKNPYPEPPMLKKKIFRF